MSSKVVASILHGAYGDYYEQAVCLKHFKRTHPDTRMKLFAASPHRQAELQVFDFSWAESFESWTEMEKHQIDEFFQFQVLDSELQSSVLGKLPSHLLSKIDMRNNRMPWKYLRSILPLAPCDQLGLAESGRRALPELMQQCSIPSTIFNGPTIGFLWRHRAPGGAIKPILQADARQLTEKYSRLFRRLIGTYGCHVLICGMKVHRTPENMHRIDAKYPEYGLNLPDEFATHLKGLSWALELEVLSRCTVCVVNPSGFSEALWIKRNSGVLLVDPSLHYLAKAMWHRMPLFNLSQPGCLVSTLASRWESLAFHAVKSELDNKLSQQASDPVFTN